MRKRGSDPGSVRFFQSQSDSASDIVRQDLGAQNFGCVTGTVKLDQSLKFLNQSYVTSVLNSQYPLCHKPDSLLIQSAVNETQAKHSFRISANFSGS
jgi:hypothetical protein